VSSAKTNMASSRLERVGTIYTR